VYTGANKTPSIPPGDFLAGGGRARATPPPPELEGPQGPTAGGQT